MTIRRYTEPERRRIVARIVDARSAGMELRRACQREGVTDMTFYKWAKEFGVDPRGGGPRAEAAPADDPDPESEPDEFAAPEDDDQAPEGPGGPDPGRPFPAADPATPARPAAPGPAADPETDPAPGPAADPIPDPGFRALTRAA